MARVTLGGVISSISGSVGSACFRNSPSGVVLYNRPLCSQRGTPAQHTNRSILKAAASAWGRLDDDIRTAWGSLAKQEHIPTFFSRGRRWTGRQLFTCFYFYAELQLTPLPPRWLPTPPIFWPNPYFEAALFYPYLIEPDPLDPNPFTPYWSSQSSITVWRPVSLNPTDPGGLASDTPASFFVGSTPVNSLSPPRQMTLLWCSSLTPRPVPVSPSYLNAAANLSQLDSLYRDLCGLPPGLTWNMSAPVPRSLDLWFSVFALSDDRLYFSGLVNCGCVYSGISPVISPDTWICAPVGASYTVGFLPAASANYPSSEV